MKSFFKRAIRSLGYDLRRYSPTSSEVAQFMAILSTHRINLVLDVGANVGQFAKHLREAGYCGRIVSFEPLSVEREQLLAASSSDSSWEVAPQAAIGSEDGEIEVHIAGNSQSSSVLPMLDAHSSAAPGSSYVGTERVPLKRLDTLVPHYLQQESVPFLKIDTQGYEEQVLKGADRIFDRIAGVQLELSLVQLYEGQRLFCDLIEQMKNKGFELWAISPVFIDPQSGRLLQVDATFFRS